MKMLFQDKNGKILLDEELDEMSSWEIEERGIHATEGEEG
jgi:hypothetical protein